MDTARIQIIAIIGSIALFLFILYLIRQRKLREEYSFLWLFFSFIFIVFSFWREGLDFVSDLIGVSYPPAAIFLILFMAVFLIMIEFSVIISRQSTQIKKMSQELGLLKLEFEKLKNNNDQDVKKD